MPSTPIANQYHQSQPERQISNHPPKQEQQLYHKLQSPSQSEHRILKPPLSLAAIHRRSPSNANSNVSLETISKTNNSRRESQASKSSFMRGGTLKRNEEIHKEKPKDQQSLSNESKTLKSKLQNASSQTDDPSDLEKTKPNKKQTDSKSEIKKAPSADGKQNDKGKPNHTKRQPHVHKNRRNDYQTDDDYSTDDDDDNSTCPRCKSRKRTPFSDRKLDKHPRLPPLRPGRMLSHHDPYINAPLPSRRPLQRRFSIDDPPPPGLHSNRHGRHPMYRDTGNIPSYRDPYDPSFDHRNRNTKPNRRNDKINPYFDQEDNRRGMHRDDGPIDHRPRIGKNKHANFNDPVGRKSRQGPEECLRSQRASLRYSPDYYDERDNWRQEKREHSKLKLHSNAPDASSQQAFRSGLI
jgi:hypothetical protein